MSDIFIKESTLTDIGNAIRYKTGESDLICPLDMATKIYAIESIPQELLSIGGDCVRMFQDSNWSWVIRQYGDRIRTSGLRTMSEMFKNTDLQRISFEFNCGKNIDTNSMFYNATNLIESPKFNGVPSVQMTCQMFYGCEKLRNLPEGFETWFVLSDFCMTYEMFRNCYSLREVPVGLFSTGTYNYYNYVYFVRGFLNCYTLNKLENLPISCLAGTAFSNNLFNTTFSSCSRLANVTFAALSDSLSTMNWKSQTIDLSNYVGYASSANNILNYNSGITADKEVKDDTTYQALKDNPDWWTTNIAYSRYNRASAVATINSLPDTSAYLASSGGTNTIKFKGGAGSATDAGAINTLTASEIAVATAKGWTCSFV